MPEWWDYLQREMKTQPNLQRRLQPWEPRPRSTHEHSQSPVPPPEQRQETALDTPTLTDQLLESTEPTTPKSISTPEQFGIPDWAATKNSAEEFIRRRRHCELPVQSRRWHPKRLLIPVDNASQHRQLQERISWLGGRIKKMRKLGDIPPTWATIYGQRQRE